jgi:uncharacterized protein (TIGR03581 family)
MINWYNERICLNVLAKNLENAVDIYEATEGHVLVGLLSANYDTVDAAVEDIKKHQSELSNHVSIGLGGGNPKQWKMVAQISEKTHALHANQVFSAVGYTRALSSDETFVNALVSPSGEVGFVKISTGPLSKDEKPAIVPIKTAIAMAKEMGGNSLKFFPMKGLGCIEEYKEVARICGLNNFALEPTGGIDLSNFEEIIRIAYENNVPKIIPHVYSSIVDDNGVTKIEDVKKLYEMIKKVMK